MHPPSVLPDGCCQTGRLRAKTRWPSSPTPLPPPAKCTCTQARNAHMQESYTSILRSLSPASSWALEGGEAPAPGRRAVRVAPAEFSRTTDRGTAVPSCAASAQQAAAVTTAAPHYAPRRSAGPRRTPLALRKPSRSPGRNTATQRHACVKRPSERGRTLFLLRCARVATVCSRKAQRREHFRPVMSPICSWQKK